MVRRVLVLGGAGFIGRHAVAALERMGATVTIGSRDPARSMRRIRLERAYRWVRVRLHERTHPSDWQTLTSSFDAIVNCVGILRPRAGESYDAVHHRAPAAIARAAAMTGTRFVHLSALGLEVGSRSGFVRSKRRGEAALLAAPGDITIVRASLVDGDGGFGARWIRRVADWSWRFVPTNAVGQIAPLAVEDLGEALAVLGLATGARRVCEVGGNDCWSLSEYFDAMRTRPDAGHTIAIPAGVARLGSHICDLLHVTPFSFGHYELLTRDNRPAQNSLPALLGRPPRPVCRRRLRPGVSPGAEAPSFRAGVSSLALSHERTHPGDFRGTDPVPVDDGRCRRG